MSREVEAIVSHMKHEVLLHYSKLFCLCLSLSKYVSHVLQVVFVESCASQLSILTPQAVKVLLCIILITLLYMCSTSSLIKYPLSLLWKVAMSLIL